MEFRIVVTVVAVLELLATSASSWNLEYYEHDDFELDSMILSETPIVPINNMSSSDPGEAGINVNCRTSRNGSVVVDGRVELESDDFSYIVALTIELGNETEILCTGSLISDQWVLTSGAPFYTTIYSVIIADKKNMYMYNASSEHHARKVTAYITGINEQNIGLIKLDKPVVLGGKLRPVCLSDKEPSAGDEAVVVGWGSPEGPSTSLQNATVTLLNKTECVEILNGTGDADKLSDRMFCAENKEFGKNKGPCVQDFGGPLLSLEDGAQIGIVTWTPGHEPCGEPALYTRVDKYFDWIVKNVNRYK